MNSTLYARISPQRLSKLRWLWLNVPWQVACELILDRSPHYAWISTLSEDENPNFSRSIMLVAACHVIQLFHTSLLRTIKQPKHRQSCFLQFTQLLHILFWCLTHCDILTQILMHCTITTSRCIQLKSWAANSKWCTGHKFGVYSIHLAHQIHVCA